MKILIVDDNPVNITVLEGFVRKLGYRATSAGSGEEALRLFEAERPDVVLLDLMMPGLNGGEVAQRMRLLAGRHWIPILIVSASSQEKDRSFSLTQGADGYLVKPVSFQALASELAAMRRIAELQRQLEIQLEQLQRYRDYIEDEQRLARYILKHLMPPPELDGLCTCIQPARGFSGDYIAAVARPRGRTYLILADATGHGLSAAVCLIPVFTIFEGMTRKDHPIGEIAREMNRELKKRIPTGHFVAVTLALVNEERGTTEIWNGGNPAALLRCAGGLEHEARSRHPPVGLLDEERFDASTESLNWQEACDLLLVSDGVVEAGSPGGEQFGIERVREAFRAGGGDACNDLLRRVLEHIDDRPADDDMSVLGLKARRRAATEDAATADEGCELRLRLGPAQIRALDLPGAIADWGRHAGWTASLLSRVPLAATELWANAVDHGLLRLDSALKDEADGMERYFRLRAERLAGLNAGSIEVVVRTRRDEGGLEVELSLEDSGPGFDFAPWLKAEPTPEPRYAGRGLHTVRALARTLNFDKDGRRVEARFRPEAPATRRTEP